MKFIRQAVKRFVPDVLLAARRNYQISKLRETFEPLSVKEAFTTIYSDALWGKSATTGGDFFSGSGSHQPNVVATYVTAVKAFLESLDTKPSAVDLGCGDFSVGS